MGVGVLGADGRVGGAGVFRVLGVPVGGVEGAHLALLVSTSGVALVQDVRAEGVARVRVGNGRVGSIVRGLGVAGGAAEVGVNRAGLEELVAEVAPSVLAVVERCVHGSGVELLGTVPTIDGAVHLVGGVGVAASDGDPELGAPLAGVSEGLLVKASAPVGALHVEDGIREGADISIRSLGRVTLEVDVEGEATSLGVALVSAVLDIVLSGLDDAVSQVVHSTVGSTLVLEVLVVTNRGGCSVCFSGDVRIGLELGRIGQLNVVKVGEYGFLVAAVATLAERLTGDTSQCTLQLGASVDNDVCVSSLIVVGTVLASRVDGNISGGREDRQRSSSDLRGNHSNVGRGSVRNILLKDTSRNGVSRDRNVTQIIKRKRIRSGIRVVGNSNRILGKGKACQSWEENGVAHVCGGSL